MCVSRKKMAAYLRSVKFLRIFSFRKNFNISIFKLYSAPSCDSFSALSLEKCLVERLNNLNITKLTEIQTKSLHPILKGDSVIINAETGSGKTLCYLVPVIDRILKKRPPAPSAVIIVPNMDLGFQITDFANKLLNPGLSALPLHRGSQLRINREYPIIISTFQVLIQYNIKNLTSLQTVIIDEADLVISNGGKRFWKLMQLFQNLNDNPTNNGLELSKNKSQKSGVQHVFVAATLPDRGDKSVFRQISKHISEINHITTTSVHRYTPSLRNVDVCVRKETKLPQLLKYLNILAGELPLESVKIVQGSETSRKVIDEFASDGSSAILSHMNSVVKPQAQRCIKVLIFANTISMVKTIYNFLNCEEGRTFEMLEMSSRGYGEIDKTRLMHPFYKDSVKTASTVESSENFLTETGLTNVWRNKVGVLHKEMSSSERQEVLRRFRENGISVLVSTDLASRGLDIPHVSHVIQVDYARNAADTLHRAGRTARAGSLGINVNFITEEDKEIWNAVKLAESRSFQGIFSRKRQFSRRIKQQISRMRKCV